MKETKEFYKTSEFWLMVLGQIVLMLQDTGALNLVSEKYNWLAPILQVVLASSYIQSRGKAKSGVPATDDDKPLVEPAYPDQVGKAVVEPGTNVTVEH